MTEPAEIRLKINADKSAEEPASRLIRQFSLGAGIKRPRQALLQLRDICAGPESALWINEVNVSIYPREIVALVGDNGAGKSTVVSVMSGIYRPSGGRMMRDGQDVSFRSVNDANRVGITTVFQDSPMCEKLNVSSNVFLGQEISDGPFLRQERMFQKTREVLDKLGSTLSPRRVVHGLSAGERRTIALARALLSDPHVMVLDEPTAALSPLQTGQVLDQMLALRNMGKGLMFVCHDLIDVFSVSDRIYVMRHGRIVAELRTAETTYDEVLGYMAGIKTASL